MGSSNDIYDIRGLRGKLKGKFVKKSVVVGMENAQKGRSEPRAPRAMDGNLSGLTKPQIFCLRLVDLDVLGDELWCRRCDIPLSIKNRAAEAKIGLASILTVTCQQCRHNHSVHTHKKDQNNSTYEMNSRSAFGMIDAGIGPVNTLLSALNAPSVNHTTLKRYERIIGPAIERVAEKSCIESIRLEKEFT
ncbi:hypothetical protein QAD02_020599 [Eretmocerus hayati]|uniref:Uncharacterized protein n=1 Tax=Eretmocerus hayati TaxID=131215 RepID=A0ACC2PPS6_9HYME|nr:hypothetical protein QAD02_020599 [Eretmocerus hayati]